MSFNFFTRFVPTHFGNEVALYLPVKYKKFDLLIDFHSYSNKVSSGLGFGAGLFNYAFAEKMEADFILNIWNQPESFFDNSKVTGGQIELSTRYSLNRNFSGFVSVCGKTKGWIIANPYLDENVSFRFGLNYNLIKT